MSLGVGASALHDEDVVGLVWFAHKVGILEAVVPRRAVGAKELVGFGAVVCSLVQGRLGNRDRAQARATLQTGEKEQDPHCHGRGKHVHHGLLKVA